MSAVKLAMVVAALALAGACSGDDGSSGGEPVFPDDYATTYTEVRNCRPNGGSHDFNQIRVLADPTGLAAYRDRVADFPEGAIVLKEEYDSSDSDCSGAIVQWSVMQRLPDGNEDLLGWRWQQVGFSRTVNNEDEPRCIGCHADCVAPEGYHNTCTVP